VEEERNEENGRRIFTRFPAAGNPHWVVSNQSSHRIFTLFALSANLLEHAMVEHEEDFFSWGRFSLINKKICFLVIARMKRYTEDKCANRKQR
jgi:hypothetical protein